MTKKNKANTNKLISVKEIMRQYNISYQTVNHYTDFGLLPVSVKKGNMRLYNRNQIEKRLKMIRELIREGYSLRLIRKKIVGI